MASLYLNGNPIDVPIDDQIHKTNRRRPRATTKTIDLVGGTITPQHLGKIGSKVAATNKTKTKEFKNPVQIPHGVNAIQFSTSIFGKLLVEKKNVGRSDADGDVVMSEAPEADPWTFFNVSRTYGQVW
ncbi:hypothetical protein N7493_008679 [Penicillium malachiteum]|uniref:Uncharacterized protein n=1 Tax=Penicillium malachiteum TaxID=1324776 RepID=A0AAD6HF89_9EURO|nr:hypothetical protein N7493_008679 [Penicillium malachiteum]